MAKLDIVRSIMSRFNTAWATTGFPVAYTDVPLTPALTAMIDGEDGVALTPWARPTIRTNRRKQNSLGSGGDGLSFIEFGALFVEIYTPTGQGLKQAYELGQVLLDAFEGVSENNGIWYRNAYLQESGAEGLWSHINFIVEWQVREYR